MKKSNYQAAICLFAGFVGAELAYAAMFKILHWPGGTALMLFGLILLIVLSCLAIPCIISSETLNTLAKNGVRAAGHLRNVLVLLLIAIMFICIGGISIIYQFPFRGWLILLGSTTASICIALAGFFGFWIYKK